MDVLASKLACNAKTKAKPKKGVKRLSKNDTKENKKKIVSQVDSITVEKSAKKEKNLPKTISSKKKELIKDVLLNKKDSQVQNLTKQNAKDKATKIKRTVKNEIKSSNKKVQEKEIKPLKKVKAQAVNMNAEVKTQDSATKNMNAKVKTQDSATKNMNAKVKTQDSATKNMNTKVKTQDSATKKRKAPIKEEISSLKVAKKNKSQTAKPVVVEKKTVELQLPAKTSNNNSKKSKKNKLLPVKSNVIEKEASPLKIKEIISTLKKTEKTKPRVIKDVLLENTQVIIRSKENTKALKKLKSQPTESAAAKKNEEIKNIKSKKRKQPEEEEQTSGPNLKKKEVINFVKALIKVIESQQENKKNLFDDSEKPPILLNINCFKIPKVPLHQHRITLPHSMINPTDDIAIFVKDLKRGRRRDPEDTVRHYEDLFQEHGITRIKTIIPINQVKTEYRQFEMRRRLFNSYDFFLADGSISGHLAHLLGKQFREKRKLPTSVHMQRGNLKEEIDNALMKTCLQIHGHGDNSIVQIATCSMKVEQIADNILAVIEDLTKNYPGGWANIRSLMIKTPLSLAIPIYVSLKNKNDVAVPVITPKRPKAYKEVEGELSTFTSNVKVHVTPDGTVRLERIANDDSDEETKEDVEKVVIKQEKKDNVNKTATSKVAVKEEKNDEDDEEDENDESSEE